MTDRPPVMEWSDGALSTTPLGDDRFAICVDGNAIGEIVVYPSFPGAWQKVHGYGDAEKLWTFDIDITDVEYQGKGHGSRVVRRMCEAVLQLRDATRMVVDVLADNPLAIAAYEKAGFHKVRFLPNHNDGDGSIGDAWLMEFRP